MLEEEPFSHINLLNKDESFVNSAEASPVESATPRKPPMSTGADTEHEKAAGHVAIPRNLRPPDCHQGKPEETTHVEEPGEVLETGDIVAKAWSTQTMPQYSQGASGAGQRRLKRRRFQQEEKRVRESLTGGIPAVRYHSSTSSTAKRTV